MRIQQGVFFTFRAEPAKNILYASNQNLSSWQSGWAQLCKEASPSEAPYDQGFEYLWKLIYRVNGTTPAVAIYFYFRTSLVIFWFMPDSFFSRGALKWTQMGFTGTRSRVALVTSTQPSGVCPYHTKDNSCETNPNVPIICSLSGITVFPKFQLEIFLP